MRLQVSSVVRYYFILFDCNSKYEDKSRFKSTSFHLNCFRHSITSIIHLQCVEKKNACSILKHKLHTRSIKHPRIVLFSMYQHFVAPPSASRRYESSYHYVSFALPNSTIYTFGMKTLPSFPKNIQSLSDASMLNMLDHLQLRQDLT